MREATPPNPLPDGPAPGAAVPGACVPPAPPVPAAPPVPPTPPVPLAALLAREDLGLRQLTGPPATDVTVHWVHTSEMADPLPYLLGGELLLTAGVHAPEAAAVPDGYFDDYAARIVAAGGAALGFGLAPVHDTVPEALRAACEARGLALVEVPPRTTFSAVARAVWQLMAQARLAELRRVSEAQRGLAAAAARPDPVPAVLRRLAARLDGWAVLHGPGGTPVASAGREPAAPVRRGLADLARHVTGRASATASDTVAGTRLAAYALGTGRGFALGIAAERREPGDQTITSLAAVLLSLLTGEHHSRSGAGRSSALVRLLLGAGPEEVAPLLLPEPAEGADGTAGGRWYVVHARADGRAVPDATTVAALGTALGSPLIDRADDVVRLLIPAGAAPGTGPGTVPASPEPGPPAGPGRATRTAPDPGAETGPGTHEGTGAGGGTAGTGAAPGEGGDAVGTGTACRRGPAEGAGPGPRIPPEPIPRPARGPRPAPDPARGPRPGPDPARGPRPPEPRAPGTGTDTGPRPQPGWTLGVSAAVTPDEWPAADAQAARALARARATRVPLVRHGARPALADLVPDGDADAHARALLAPLAGAPALTETLRTWLSLHGSWEGTAVALSVHRNTVRQRIARCAALLDADLDDPDVRMELWFALRRR
ncbi:helix-turn-helix domain-containing protein [Streptomyces sp. SCSIO 75703]|uniref:helix-turn-helix domain-containing protein n=2 Tax=unclassified Streptomyces TaxID=2593676 RepID=UPI0030CB1D25